MASICPAVGKECWPELVGKNGSDVKPTIELEHPGLEVIIVLEGTIVTWDYRCDRVRIWVNDKGVVIAVPCIG